jgi:hypothetical protein
MPTLGQPENRTPMLGPNGLPANNWAQWFTRVWSAVTGQYFYIPAVSGVPSGAPEVRGGFVPIVYDTANDDLYAYNGGWVKVTLS